MVVKKMILRGIDNQSVELKLVSYEFPNNEGGDYDSNWLNVFLKVDSKDGKWQTVNPSLLTWEVMALINWFSDLSENREVKHTLMEFLEPNLSFELINECDSEIKSIRILFDLEARPRSATDDKEYFVDCKLDKNDLRQIAIELSKELEKYPERCASS